MTEPRPELPVNSIPPVVVALVLLIAVIEGAVSLAASGLLGGAAGIGWRATAIGDWGYSPAVWDLLWDRGIISVDVLKRFVTYLFVHGSTTHALFGAAVLLALGKFVGDAFGGPATLAVFLLSGIGGAVAYGLLLDQNMALVGCYPGSYGLIGAFTYLMWVRLGRLGQSQLRAFRLIGVLLAVQLLYSLIFGSQPGWIADLAGFLTGLVLSPVLAPGGWRAFVGRLRQR